MRKHLKKTSRNAKVKIYYNFSRWMRCIHGKHQHHFWVLNSYIYSAGNMKCLTGFSPVVNRRCLLAAYNQEFWVADARWDWRDPTFKKCFWNWMKKSRFRSDLKKTGPDRTCKLPIFSLPSFNDKKTTKIDIL